MDEEVCHSPVDNAPGNAPSVNAAVIHNATIMLINRVMQGGVYNPDIGTGTFIDSAAVAAENYNNAECDLLRRAILAEDMLRNAEQRRCSTSWITC